VKSYRGFITSFLINKKTNILTKQSYNKLFVLGKAKKKLFYLKKKKLKFNFSKRLSLYKKDLIKLLYHIQNNKPSFFSRGVKNLGLVYLSKEYLLEKKNFFAKFIDKNIFFFKKIKKRKNY